MRNLMASNEQLLVKRQLEEPFGVDVQILVVGRGSRYLIGKPCVVAIFIDHHAQPDIAERWHRPQHGGFELGPSSFVLCAQLKLRPQFNLACGGRLIKFVLC